ncbi:hypothetical protein Dimus_034378 [Dionaea muscipula]
MANSICFAPLVSYTPPNRPGVAIGNAFNLRVITTNKAVPTCGTAFPTLKLQATGSNEIAKSSGSIICSDCEGNGTVSCSQCKGTGVNSQDHFNGQFKAGALCWLCRGKREILCGCCNGAGFVGGFMSTGDS